MTFKEILRRERRAMRRYYYIHTDMELFDFLVLFYAAILTWTYAGLNLFGYIK